MIELIPAIDLIDGRCVRLTKGDYATQKVYNDDPVSVARNLERLGFRRLHVVDLDGARSHHVVNIKTLEAICNATSLVVDFGGGIKTEEDFSKAVAAGAAMLTLGSIAAKEPATVMSWMEKFGAERIVLGADVRDGLISTNGWQEDSALHLMEFLDAYLGKGIRNILCTEISRDGMLQGPATPLYASIMATHPECHLIASGGVSSIDDIRELDKSGIPAVVFGKAMYEGRINLEELLKEFPQC